MTDQQALAEFVNARSTEAFSVLVQRYVDLVYSTAKRLARDAHLAEDITQAVFIVLARRAKSINSKYLAGWLVNTSRLASRDAIRSRNRLQKREAEAAQMRSEIQFGEEPTVEQITPLLDDALAKLSEADRSAVVLRFLQGKCFAEVGYQLEISEEAARKRVGRSIEKLRSILCKQGITASVGGLAITLAAHQATAAPVALANQAALAISSQPASAAAIAKGVAWTMKFSKTRVVAVSIFLSLAMVGGGVFVFVSAQHPASIASAATMPAAPATAPVPTTMSVGARMQLLEDLQAALDRQKKKLSNIQIEAAAHWEKWDSVQKVWQYAGESESTSWYDGKPDGKVRIDYHPQILVWTDGAGPLLLGCF